MARMHLPGGAVLAAALVGLGTAALADETFRIGSFLAVTGPAALLGDPEKKTLELYVEKINEEGGVLGMPVELVVYDTGMNAKDAVTYARRLIENDGVDALIGGTTTGETMAVIDMVEEAQIPFISLAGAAVVVEPVRPWVFKTPHTDRMAIEKVYEDMQSEGVATIGLIAGSGGFDQSCLANAELLADDYELTIAAKEIFGAGDTDMTPQLTRIKGAGVDAILFCGFGAPSVVVTRNHAQLAIETPFYHTHGSCSKQFVEGAGEAAEGVRLPCAALVVAEQLPDDDPQKEVTTAYAETYQSAYGEEVSTFGGHAYDALFLLIGAVERAGSKEPAAVREALEQTAGFVGADGIFTMSADDHVGLGPESFKMLEVAEGDWKLLY
jgi:branched-chain amino acid transport system substrate-binding protein